MWCKAKNKMYKEICKSWETDESKGKTGAEVAQCKSYRSTIYNKCKAMKNCRKENKRRSAKNQCYKNAAAIKVYF